jgi:hypothetical protein
MRTTKAFFHLSHYHYHHRIIQATRFQSAATHFIPSKDLKRRHFKSYGDLISKTNELIDLVKNPVRAIAEAGSPITVHDCFHTLEAWMEYAMDEKTIEAPLQAKRLLDTLERNTILRFDSVFVPKASFYEVVMQGFAVCNGGRNAAEHCQHILQNMIFQCRRYSQESRSERRIPPVEPTIKAFNISINCWAKSGADDSGKHSEAVLELMGTWKRECEESSDVSLYVGCLPNGATFASIMDAWAKGDSGLAPHRTLSILKSLIASVRAGDLHVSVLQPRLFNIALHAWARSGLGREAAQKCEDILQLMSTLEREYGDNASPNTTTYAVLIDAWANCEKEEKDGEAAQRAESILFKMIQLYRNGHGVKPNKVCFTSCVNAWSWSGRIHDAPEKAERIWRTLDELHKESGGHPDFCPDTEIGNAVLAAWSRAVRKPDSIGRALAFLEKLKLNFTTDLVSYNTVLDALGKRGLSSKSLDLLKWLEVESKDRDLSLQPDVRTYNSVLASIAKDEERRCPKKAEELLQTMQAKSSEGRHTIKPDRVSYTIVIDAWSRSDDPRRVEKAKALFVQLINEFQKGDQNMQPDAYVFTVLMKTCLGVTGSDERKRFALRLLVDTMKLMKSAGFGPPNHVTYATYTKAVERLCDNDELKRKLLIEAFKDCAAGGHVSKKVVFAMRPLGIASIQMKTSWSRNVPNRFKPDTNKWMDWSALTVS